MPLLFSHVFCSNLFNANCEHLKTTKTSVNFSLFSSHFPHISSSSRSVLEACAQQYIRELELLPRRFFLMLFEEICPASHKVGGKTETYIFSPERLVPVMVKPVPSNYTSNNCKGTEILHYGIRFTLTKGKAQHGPSLDCRSRKVYWLLLLLSCQHKYEKMK